MQPLAVGVSKLLNVFDDWIVAGNQCYWIEIDFMQCIQLYHIVVVCYIFVVFVARIHILRNG